MAFQPYLPVQQPTKNGTSAPPFSSATHKMALQPHLSSSAAHKKSHFIPTFHFNSTQKMALQPYLLVQQPTKNGT
jgi:hypothetical protein